MFIFKDIFEHWRISLKLDAEFNECEETFRKSLLSVF